MRKKIIFYLVDTKIVRIFALQLRVKAVINGDYWRKNMKKVCILFGRYENYSYLCIVIKNKSSTN